MSNYQGLTPLKEEEKIEQLEKTRELKSKNVLREIGQLVVMKRGLLAEIKKLNSAHEYLSHKKNKTDKDIREFAMQQIDNIPARFNELADKLGVLEAKLKIRQARIETEREELVVIYEYLISIALDKDLMSL